MLGKHITFSKEEGKRAVSDPIETFLHFFNSNEIKYLLHGAQDMKKMLKHSTAW